MIIFDGFLNFLKNDWFLIHYLLQIDKTQIKLKTVFLPLKCLFTYCLNKWDDVISNSVVNGVKIVICWASEWEKQLKWRLFRKYCNNFKFKF